MAEIAPVERGTSVPEPNKKNPQIFESMADRDRWLSLIKSGMGIDRNPYGLLESYYGAVPTLGNGAAGVTFETGEAIDPRYASGANNRQRKTLRRLNENLNVGSVVAESGGLIYDPSILQHEAIHVGEDLATRLERKDGGDGRYNAFAPTSGRENLIWKDFSDKKKRELKDRNGRISGKPELGGLDDSQAYALSQSREYPAQAFRWGRETSFDLNPKATKQEQSDYNEYMDIVKRERPDTAFAIEAQMPPKLVKGYVAKHGPPVPFKIPKIKEDSDSWSDIFLSMLKK